MDSNIGTKCVVLGVLSRFRKYPRTAAINNRKICSVTGLVVLLGIRTRNTQHYDSVITTADYDGNRIEYVTYRSALGSLDAVIEILSSQPTVVGSSVDNRQIDRNGRGRGYHGLLFVL